MSYQLRPDLSYCRVDGRLIFLDIRNDRYFRLSDAMERTFTMHLCGSGRPEADIGGLIELGLLVESRPNLEPAPSPAIESPSHSALESPPSAEPIRMSPLLDVFGIVCMTQVHLKTCSMKWTLSTLAAYRQRKAPQTEPESGKARERRLSRTAAAFLRARPYVPIDTCCLIDSISLVRFLAKRGMAANLVFGVTGSPFSAHCWVQVGPLVLNDTLGNTHAHTPIRVV
ncbi:lasso peptide biosynthesis B2 protein [Pseudoxanthomonas sp. UTMC 1351]|uniref:lasso peptide biosynthesis B2 protein n=1 Tax=Pseudoxanthomonas sp. UTMC 1351 TaxID=2695853 RepID=UPI0034CD933A